MLPHAVLLASLLVLAPLAAADPVTVTYLGPRESDCSEDDFWANSTSPELDSQYYAHGWRCRAAATLLGVGAEDGSGTLAVVRVRDVSEESGYGAEGTSRERHTWNSTATVNETGRDSFEGLRAEHAVRGVAAGRADAGCREHREGLAVAGNGNGSWPGTTWSNRWESAYASGWTRCGVEADGVAAGQAYRANATRTCASSTGAWSGDGERIDANGTSTNADAGSRASDGCFRDAGAIFVGRARHADQTCTTVDGGTPSCAGEERAFEGVRVAHWTYPWVDRSVDLLP